MSCNQTCNQGRTCDCVANDEYASSTQVPGNPAMQRGPLTEREITMIEPDHWSWIGDIAKSFLAVLACAVVGVLVLIALGPK